jgi:hypothetical protein
VLHRGADVGWKLGGCLDDEVENAVEEAGDHNVPVYVSMTFDV